jgi:glycolate oxidase iron-sulfur subunit
MDLRLDPELLNACVQCGLCLTACPTYQVTGDETRSPRGRIALMREVEQRGAPVTREVLRSFETCIQCRGCEPACPSDVQFGRLMEQTRVSLAEAGRITPWWQRLALRTLGRPKLLRAGTFGLAVVQRLVPLPASLPRRLPFRQRPLTPSGEDVYLFTGCIMDAWQRDVHAAGKRVLEAAGFGVTPTGDAAPCCGALHLHAGLSEARVLAERTIRSLGGDDRPIVVDAAGCGAAMKDYGELLATEEARALASRVVDIQEFLAQHLERLPAAPPLALRVAIQDPCHQRHVQRVHRSTRTVLRPYVTEIVELDDDGLCCGAGGAYSIVEPELASEVRERKLAAIGRAEPTMVASANPGCALHLAAGGARTVHPMQIVDRALAGGSDR